MKELALILLVTYFVGHHLFWRYASLKRKQYVRLSAGYHVLGAILCAAWIISLGWSLYTDWQPVNVIFGIIGIGILTLNVVATLNRIFPPAKLSSPVGLITS